MVKKQDKSEANNIIALRTPVKKIINKVADGGVGEEAGEVKLKPLRGEINHSPFNKRAWKRNPQVYPDRGVVYLSHIPHGFYEDEMKSFFAQFGHVTRLRLVRSHKTGNSKGYAFVEFRFREVAQVVADTMNNYLMRNRLLKATVIPPEKQSSNMFRFCRNYGPDTCIGYLNRRRAVKQNNKSLSDEQTEKRVNRHKDHLVKLQEKLKAQGVDCLFQIEGGSSKRLLEGTDNSLPVVKKAKISSTSETVTSSKNTVSTSAIKKEQSAAKVQDSLKSSKKPKATKAAGDKSTKQNAAKNEKKKTVVKKAIEKKTAEKKSVKKVVKKKIVGKPALTKKDAQKKMVVKKQLAKK